MEDKDYQIGRRIFKLAYSMNRRSNTYLSEAGLTDVQAESLVYAADHPGSTINDLKEHLVVSHQAAQGVLKRMADKDLIMLEQSEEDKRCRVIVLTEKGRQIRKRLIDNALDTGQDILEGVSKEEKEVFYQVLLKALENVKKGNLPFQK